MNDVDWGHVVEEIEELGLCELNAVRIYLRLTLIHLLKLRGWPDSAACPRWRLEVANFRAEADERFVPSMRHRLDLMEIYLRAVRQLSGAEIDGRTAGAFPRICPLPLDDLLTMQAADLEARVGTDGSTRDDGGEPSVPTS